MADLALAVADAWQRRGIGHGLAARLVERARANDMTALTGSMLASNRGARALLDRLGFRVRSLSGGVLEAELALARVVAPACASYRGARRTSGSSSRELRPSFAKTPVR